LHIELCVGLPGRQHSEEPERLEIDNGILLHYPSHGPNPHFQGSALDAQSMSDARESKQQHTELSTPLFPDIHTFADKNVTKRISRTSRRLSLTNQVCHSDANT
jgi:hypothetical protein